MNTSYDAYREEWKESGWAQLVLPLIEEAELLGANILQIKEKFGGLRFYFAFGTSSGDPLALAAEQEFQKHVDGAEELSFTVCEVCGASGKRRGGGWIRTLCDKHAEG